MPTGLATAVRQVKAFLAEADPQRVTTGQAVELVEAFIDLERLAAAGKTLFAARAAESPAWLKKGFVDASHWLSETAKVPLGEAISTIQSSRALPQLPGTADALRDGRLSAAQTREVARAGSKDPSSESEMLALAESESLRSLKNRADEVVAQSASREEETARHRKIHQRRNFRHFTDHQGGFRLDALLTQEAGARLLSSIQAEADAIFKEARLAGTEEPSGAYRADALVALVTGTGRTGCSRSNAGNKRAGERTDSVVVRVDAEALLRGHVKSGEICHLPGVGPVPVAAVRRLLPGADVNVVFRNTVDVLGVCHLGRRVTTHQQQALEDRDPVCVVQGCSVATRLENHHWREDFAVSGRTSLDDLARVCSRHHDLITYSGWVLDGGPGKWRFLPPPDIGDGLLDTG